MAEVIGCLDGAEAPKYMPMRELHDAHQTEVYKAVGEELDLYCELFPDLPYTSGAYLVKLASEQLVSFRWGGIFIDPEITIVDDFKQ